MEDFDTDTKIEIFTNENNNSNSNNFISTLWQFSFIELILSWFQYLRDFNLRSLFTLSANDEVLNEDELQQQVYTHSLILDKNIKQDNFFINLNFKNDNDLLIYRNNFFNSTAPLPILVLIIDFLDIRSLCTTAIVCTSFYRAALYSEDTRWQHLLSIEYPNLYPEVNTRKQFLALTNDLQNYNRKQSRYKKCSWLFHFFQGPCFIILIPTLILIFIIYFVVGLDNYYALPSFMDSSFMNWKMLSPLLLAMIIFLIGLICICYSAHIKSPVPFDDHVYDDDRGLLKKAVDFIGRYNMPAHCVGFILLGLFFLFILLFALQVTFTIQIPYTIVLFPIFIILLVSLFFPCHFCCGDCLYVNQRRMRFFIFITIFFSLPTLIVLILLGIRLDITFFHMAIVFIPFWFVDGLAFCCCLYAVRQSLERIQILWAIIFFVPLFVTQILICVKLDLNVAEPLSFAVVFVTFFVWSGICLCFAYLYAFKMVIHLHR